MRCALCKGESQLRNSHIIPEFVYKDLYDEKHTFHVVSTITDRTKPKEQKGIREKLLCDKCEQKLSVYEKYAREVVNGGVPFNVVRSPGKIELSDLDYKKFKLFLLSVLWRASVSAHPLFSRVRLGPHEENIRQMLSTEDPGCRKKYPTVIFGLAGDRKITRQLIDQPSSLRVEGMRCYRFIFLGLMWVFIVASHTPSSLLLQHVISEDGRLTVYIKDFEDLRYLLDFAKDLVKMGRL